MDIIKKINEVDELTQSQKNRLDLQIQIQNDLIEFMRVQIDQVTNQQSLKALVLLEIQEKMQRCKDNNEEISWNVLTQLLKVAGDSDSSITLGLFDIIKGNQKTIIEKESKTNEAPPEEDKPPEIDNATLTAVKDFVDIMKKIRTSEFKEGENV